ncbi:hypothetical protein FB565_006209 [Actinoplanes lutulentus]|uniref:DUF4034 domain-containing protein n=1 Tax=Actinoplanes lutulentus TaxID=1287878 RepID=A0A327YZM9_9ACTN|nr:hypothetical protein [Actinoplanes lutulentus]MBB2946441.1 hypothetical protein [Actinoplanes lutulentus]RAK25417.1 hypothetical protein B0I29_13427 [Actinoplanes lutulentus]
MSDRFLVRVKPDAAYPEVAAVRAALRAGDWQACRAVLDQASPGDRTTIIRCVDSTRRAGALLTGVVADDPDDSTAAATLGYLMIAGAWRIRTGARARHVGRRRFARFHARLFEAEKLLRAALDRHPADPALWSASLLTARGLEMGLPEARSRYARIAEIEPHHYVAQSQMVQQLSPKWGGSWAAVHAFAREAMLAAPEGTHTATLVVEAHLEGWLENSDHYFRRPEVRAAITAAAERSVLHPEFRRDIGWVRAVNTFALAFDLMRDRESAAAMFRAAGPYCSEYPWIYRDSAVAAFRQARAQALGWSGPAVVDRLLAVTSPANRRGIFGLLGMAWR